MSFLITCHRNRPEVFEGFLYVGAAAMTLPEADILRFRVAHGSLADAIIDITGDVASDNGSTITIDDRGAANRPAAYTVSLSEDDTALLTLPSYDVEIIRVLDGVEARLSNRVVETGTLAVLGTVGAA